MAQAPDHEPSSASGEAAAAPTPDATPSPAAEPATPAPARPAPRSLGPAFKSDLLDRLPLGEGIWSVFETVEPTAILDRMGSAGLYVGEAGLVGIRGSSWTQSSWSIGDFDITDPDRTAARVFRWWNEGKCSAEPRESAGTAAPLP